MAHQLFQLKNNEKRTMKSILFSDKRIHIFIYIGIYECKTTANVILYAIIFTFKTQRKPRIPTITTSFNIVCSIIIRREK